ncbi:ZIP family metal transporter [Candidatus Bathyarchaeota archaeon ex4484_205]|nr:MAG: ZIP family metal transporter [Candidatus Bathyarchaeota archaeon ex4484_205]
MMDLAEILYSISGGNPLLMAMFAGVFTTILNSVGVLPLLIVRKAPQKFLDASLGFAAGVMLCASFTSLILPGIDTGGIAPVIIGIILGVTIIMAIDLLLPHLHLATGRDDIKLSDLNMIWLFALAVTIHNMPEGLSVGVGFGAGEEFIKDAIILSIAIGIQNIPEGLSVGLSFLSVGYTLPKSLVIAVLSGLVEIPLSVVAAAATQISAGIVPYAMGFAAGAMIFVIVDEILPEVGRKGHERFSSIGLMMGLIVMLSLDVLLT